MLRQNILHVKKFEEFDKGTQQSTAYTAPIPEVDPLASSNLDRPKSAVTVDFTESTPKVSTATIVEQTPAQNIRMKSTAEKDVKVEADVCRYKDNETSHNVKFDKPAGGKAPCLSSGDLPSLAMSRYKDVDAVNGSGSLSRLPCLGRAARRQLAAILDEFWGHIFDYHDGKTDNQNIEAFKSPLMRDMVSGLGTSWDAVSRNKKISSAYLSFGLQMGATGSTTLPRSMHLPTTETLSSRSTSLDVNYDVAPYSGNQFYQRATISGSSISLDKQRPPISSESAGSNYDGSVIRPRNRNVIGSVGYASLQKPTMNSLSAMTAERSYFDPTTIVGSESGGSSAYSKKYHSSPDISAIATGRNSLLSEANLGSAAGNHSYLDRLESERSHHVDRAPRFQSSMRSTSLWSQQPFEQLFGVPSAELNRMEVNTERRRSSGTKDDSSYTECEAKLLQSLRFCIMQLLKLEGSRWLFRRNGGCDENLIDRVAVAERISQETADDMDTNCMHRDGQLSCGGDCVWQASLVISFGVWCIRRVLDLSIAETRPELWGKYTYVLNRLQGILDPAFSKPQKPTTRCSCLEKACVDAEPMPGTFTTAAAISEAIKGVEQAISGRRGRSGTAAGDVAFPKGKENLAFLCLSDTSAGSRATSHLHDLRRVLVS